MQTLLYVAFSVAVAAFIGGLTNHLAIKMLFHPREEKRFAGRRVPFTPGLIPKRREEIAESLGRVVAEYLVTPEGLAEALRKPEMRERIERKLASWVEQSASSEETFGQVAERLLGPERTAEWMDRLAEWLCERTGAGLDWLWEEKRLGELQPVRLIPEWEERRREEVIEAAVGLLLESIREEILSAKGDRLIRQMTNRLLEEGGGFLGSLAGIFMDQDKMTQKVKLALLMQLGGPDVRAALADFIRRKLAEYERLTASELLQKLTGRDDVRGLLAERLNGLVPWRAGLERLAGMKLADVLGPQRERLLAWVQPVTVAALGLLERSIEKIVRAIELPRIVEEQVRRFPIERIEEIILSVSGREFRAITWLGALLGGIIGLFQAAVSLWWR